MKLANWVDILIIIFVLRCGYIGFRNGLFGEIFRSIGIITAIVVSIYNCGRLGKYISDHSFLSLFHSKILSIIALVIATVFIFSLIRAAVARLVKVEFGPRFSRIGGVLLGMARGGVLASLILVILLWLPTSSIEATIHERSYLGPSLIKVVPAIYDGLIRFYPGVEAPPKSEEIFEELARDRPKGEGKAGEVAVGSSAGWAEEGR